ncbi:MAG: hypothetical protein HF309_18070 [Ignavibacteria bacterium]|nr:hypothetical protein [Ignavibacteria bacterium]MCU7501185.1 hypothetical protein [Ignavibacteria bacterium]MCU7521131.1 hypothetical protein [Ignavibacteria bacterium]MCU7526515.1 hypothetical protein [Ignavibacteria bacterium]
MTMLVNYVSKLSAEDKKKIGQWASEKRTESRKRKNHKNVVAKIEVIKRRKAI